MRGFLTAILLSGLAGLLFANCSNSPLLTDGPALYQGVADAGGAPATSLMR